MVPGTCTYCIPSIHRVILLTVSVVCLIMMICLNSVNSFRVFTNLVLPQLILAVTSLISVISFAGLAIIIMIQNAGGGSSVPGWVPVAVLVVGEFAFAAGVSPLPFIILSEMFNFQVLDELKIALNSVLDR